MDPASALIWSPPHFTWMDTNFPACTPREGYPVEIQVLWVRLLRQMERLGAKPSGEPWRALADRAEESLRKFFWLEEPGYLADLLIAKSGQPAAAAVPDNALRSNFLLAIAFGFLAGPPARRAVAAALRYLFVPGALRTLAPLPVSPPLEIRRRRRTASGRSAPAVSGPLRRGRGHAAQARLSQRHRLALASARCL